MQPSTPPVRPSRESYAVTSKVAWALCERIGERFPEYGAPTELPTEEDNYDTNDAWEKQDNAYGDLLDLLRDQYDWDGYAIAKTLDMNWGNINAELVEILDAANHIRYVEHDRLIRAWVTAYELKPKYTTGTSVRINVSIKRIYAEYTGIIIGVRDSTLQYIITVPALDNGDYRSTRGLVIDEEAILGVSEIDKDLTEIEHA